MADAECGGNKNFDFRFMKTNCWLVLGTMIATSAVAQVNTNKLPEIPPPALAAPAAPAPLVVPAETKTNAPVKKAVVKAKKKIVKKAKAVVKPAAPLVPITLVAGPATVATDHVNLRGQAGLKGEVVGHVQKGDAVTVISEITLDKPKAGEPAQWAKITLPAGTKVWINSSSKFVDLTNKVVAVKKLNLRGGPGENYSVLGVLEKGASFTEVSSKGDWTQIETPASAFAFVAASYLKQEVPAIETNVPVTPVVAAVEPVPPTPTVVPEPTPVAPAATVPPVSEMSAPAPTLTTTAGQLPPNVTLPTPAPAPAPVIETNLGPVPPRVVTHEGSVRASVSPVAPTYYELYDPATGNAINYLYTTTTNLNLTRYLGLHITVTGEEGLDSRWKDTPVLTIQKIYVLSKGADTTPVAAADDKSKKSHPWYHLWLW
jgi:uncharacterized protein YgiM (DUF1202 family)